MENLLNEKQVAALLGVSVQLLRKWRSQDRPKLPHVKIANCVRYRADAVEAFVASCSVGQTTQNGGTEPKRDHGTKPNGRMERGISASEPLGFDGDR